MNPIERMKLSLEGLSVGDALGEMFFNLQSIPLIKKREVPPGEWKYTDDTEMALSIVETLYLHHKIDPDVLANGFARRYSPNRGYGVGAHLLLQRLQLGGNWRVEASRLFEGKGSYGNGAAMRVAPLGAFFGEDLEAVCKNAELSAQITHTHPEGIAGAVAVGVAAALAYSIGEGKEIPRDKFFNEIIERLAETETRRRMEEISTIAFSEPPIEIAGQFGSGQQVSAQDTVPFALWCAARHLDNYENAFWATVSGLGDCDTTCAIVGGIVSLSDSENGIPEIWTTSREPLPIDLEV